MCLLPRAVVTGATSGIGKAYATEVSLQFPLKKKKKNNPLFGPNFMLGRDKLVKICLEESCRVLNATDPVCMHVFFQLARRGLDVVLVSRCHDKLQMVAKEIGESNVKKILLCYSNVPITTGAFVISRAVLGQI